MTTRQFIRQHKKYENKYDKLFFSAIDKQFKKAAADYEQNGYFNVLGLDRERIEAVYLALYLDVMPSMSQNQYETVVLPVENKYLEKDITDILASIFQGDFTIDVWRRLANDWYQSNVLSRISKVVDTSIKRISEIIQTGIQEGQSIEVIARNIDGESTEEINRNRARLIARTETLSAMNKGRVLAMHASRLFWNKKWAASHDNRTRTSHVLVDRQGFRPLDDSYSLMNNVGGRDTMYYPGDPNGSAENVCNCRCTEVYEVARDENGNPIRKNR